MARRRPKTTTRSLFKSRRQQRIIVPQPKERPVRLHSRDAIKGELLQQEPDWFVLHRRGPHREAVGEDPLEARAVPKYQRKGSLPERIVLKWILDNLNWQEGVQFSFQSSQDGGRMELGGLVADFIIYDRRLVIEVQGPFHDAFLQSRKDDERDSTLAEFGYTVEYIDEDDIYNEVRLEHWMRQKLGLAGGHRGAGADTFSGILDGDPDTWGDILTRTLILVGIARTL